MFWVNKFYSQIVLAEVDQYVLLSKCVQIILTFAFACFRHISEFSHIYIVLRGFVTNNLVGLRSIDKCRWDS